MPLALCHVLLHMLTLLRRQAVALKPDHFRAYKLMGSALYALGDFEGAKAALKESLKCVPCWHVAGSRQSAWRHLLRALVHHGMASLPASSGCAAVA